MKSTARALSLAALMAVSLGATPVGGTVFTPAVAEEVKSAEEKALEQTLSSDEPVIEGRHEISAGHVDMGPKFVEGSWELMFHDDSTDTPVWRDPADVVLKGGDAAKMQVPDDPRYSFVQAEAGSEVFVIPQTELAGVVWPGWNTQDPEVVGRLGRGVTFTLEGVEGPGGFTLYLENGNFGAPQVLWTSDSGEPQDIWVEPNVHTHANWVFTQPGVYFVTVRVHAELADGTTVEDTARLQFAVGSQTTAEQVFDAASALPALDSSDGAGATESDASADQETKDSAPASTETAGGTGADSSGVDDSGADSTGQAVSSGEQAGDEAGGLPVAAWVGIGVALMLGAGGALWAVLRRGARAKDEALRQMKHRG